MTIPAIAVLFALLVFFVRSDRTTVTAAAIAVIAGFLLATTGAAPAITSVLTGVGNALNHIL